MKLRWVLPSLLGMLGAIALALPAAAAQLLYWNFDPVGNRLTFTTNEGVQPRAQLVFDPTRIVIDLPGTTLGRSQINQLISQEGVREVRIGQFDAQTTRLVIELEPGYTVDPLQVQVNGDSPTQWTVQLPPLQQMESPPALSTTPDTPSAPSATVAGADTQLERLQVTADGLFIRTLGETPTLEVSRSRDRREITIEMPNTAIAPSLLAQPLSLVEYGIEQITFSQENGATPQARVTLTVDPDSADWRAIASNLGGVVLLPPTRASRPAPVATAAAPATVSEPAVSPAPQSAVPSAPAPVTAPPAAPVAQASLATIQGISLEANETQLVIQADRPLTFNSGWDRATTDYRIEILGAQLAEQLAGPQLTANSPLLRLRVRQETPDTVVLLIQPAAGVLMGELNQPNTQTLALSLGRRDQQVIPVQPAVGNLPETYPSTYPSNVALPAIRNERVVVVIDPGHGGPDPGAVGIDGLQEKNVVLPISLYLAAILEEQGVQTVLTRSDDRDLDLAPRVALAERVNADLFVSIHANAISMSRPEVNGVETYYTSDSGLRLARYVHASVIQGTNSHDRGVRQARFYVLVNTSMPAILLETGFVTGSVDAYRLADPSFQQQMAQSIAQGILLYIQQNL